MSTTRHGPLVSLVVAMLDERDSIVACLESIRAQTYPAGLIEVLVVDGGSRDGCVELAAGLASQDPRIRILHNRRRIQAAGFNLGAAASVGQAIGLVSAHTTLAPDYVEQCVRVLGETAADNVGGRRDVAATTPFTEAFAAADASRFGVGGARHHYLDTECDAETAFPGFFRREVFERLGGFDEGLPIHEDYELNWRIRQVGGRIRFSPAVRTFYQPRASLRALAGQQFRYGRGKFTVARSNPGVVRPHHLAPPLLVAGLVACSVAGPFSAAARTSLVGLAVGYGAVLGAGTAIAGRGRTQAAKRRLPVVLATMHLCWGVGALTGAVRPLRRRDPAAG